MSYQNLNNLLTILDKLETITLDFSEMKQLMKHIDDPICLVNIMNYIH